MDDDSGERTNSMCAIYADVIEHELSKENTDMETVERMLNHIRQYCQTVGQVPGETPDHLEDYLFD